MNVICARRDDRARRGARSISRDFEANRRWKADELEEWIRPKNATCPVW
jgi:hypothetical protein